MRAAAAETADEAVWLGLSAANPYAIAGQRVTAEDATPAVAACFRKRRREEENRFIWLPYRRRVLDLTNAHPRKSSPFKNQRGEGQSSGSPLHGMRLPFRTAAAE